MGAMGADREKELEQELVGGRQVALVRATVLAADLAELAGPPGEQQGGALVLEARILRALGPVVARAGEPAARELVLRRAEPAEGVCGRRLGLALASAPDELGA